MKVEVTHCDITDEMCSTVATVVLNDEFTVKVDIRQIVGWKDWYDLTDAVRKAMVLMEVKQP